MRTQQTTTTTERLSTPASALAYFRGYSDGEAYALIYEDAATLREVVDAFSGAVAGRRVCRGAFQAWLSGWRAAEAMSGTAAVRS